MDPFGLKVIFITFLVFVPLERLFGMPRSRRFFVAPGQQLGAHIETA